MWAGNFHTLVNSLAKELSPGSHTPDTSDQPPTAKITTVWLDIFAISQHAGAKQQHDLADLESVIAAAKQTVLHLDPKGLVLTRIWCLFEIWKTVAIRKAAGIRILAETLDFDSAQSIFQELDCAKAQVGLTFHTLQLNPATMFLDPSIPD